MSLIERLQEVKARSKPTLASWFAGLEDDDLTAWVDACADGAISTAELVRILKDENVSAGKDAVLAHRRTHGFPG